MTLLLLALLVSTAHADQDAPAAAPAAEPAAAPAAEPAAAPAAEPTASPVEAPTVEPAPPQTLAEVWAAMPPEDLLQAAIQRRSLGDVAGARDRLLVLEEGGSLPALAAYHLAICDEVEEDYALAVAGYETLIMRWPDLPLADDARFRRAVALEDLGDHAAAVRQVRELERRGRYTALDEQSMALVRGAAEVRAGKQRRGIKRIEAALATLEGTDELTWARARGRYALAEALLDAAGAVEVRNDRRARARLAERAALLEAAQDQVIAIARLNEPEYALAGLLALGDAYLALYDALLAAAPPRGLTPPQVAIYEAELREQVDVLQVKAWRYYDEGVSLATRLQWQGAVAAALRDRRDALRAG